MQTQPTNARASEDRALRRHFTNDLQREEKENTATWDLHQWANDITSENNSDHNQYYTNLDVSLGFNTSTDDKEDDLWIKQDSECGLLEPSPSPSSSRFNHASESSDSGPFKFRARANKLLENFTSLNARVQGLETPGRSRLHCQQVIMRPTMKRKRDDYEEEQSSCYSGNEDWTTAYPTSSDDESSSSRLSISGAESSYSSKRRRTSTSLHPGQNRRSHPETRLPGVKDIIKGYERVPYNETHDPFIFFWSWLMHDREVVESLSVGL